MAAIVIMPGCARDSGNTGATVTQDSAGIAIINNAEPGSWGDTPRWSVSDSPEVRIGVVEGNPVYELRLARGAVRMPDGRFIVANAGSSELRIYDADGRHLESVGGDGEGPGEFRNIGNLWLYRADSLAVYDRSLRRVSIFDSTPLFARALQLASPGEGLTPSLADVFPDGTLLVLGSAAITPALGTGIHRRPGPVLRYAGDGTVVDTVAFAAGEEWVGIEGPGGTSLMARPFARNSYVAAVGNDIAIADAEQFEIMFYSADGTLFRRVRRRGGNRPITHDELQRFKQSRVGAARSEAAATRMREMLTQTPMPTTHPAFIEMLVDIDENVWLEEPRSAEEVSDQYSILDRNGQFLGRVAMPSGLRPLEIGSDYVLGRFVDEMGVEFIQLHDIVGGLSK